MIPCYTLSRTSASSLVVRRTRWHQPSQSAIYPHPARTNRRQKSTTTYIDQWFESIVKPSSFYERHANESILKRRRCYFYNVDFHGRLFLEETMPKNIATSIKDNKFLDFFFRRVRWINQDEFEWMKLVGIPPEDYPFVSPCGKELNFVRPAATPLVFHTLSNDGMSLMTGGNMVMMEPLDVVKLRISSTTGRLYHELTNHSLQSMNAAVHLNRHLPGASKEYGLIRSHVAVTLSNSIHAKDGNDENDSAIYSGLVIDLKGHSMVPIPWLQSHAEPGSWAMPFSNDE